jgi:hypothetical protein
MYGGIYLYPADAAKVFLNYNDSNNYNNYNNNNNHHNNIYNYIIITIILFVSLIIYYYTKGNGKLRILYEGLYFTTIINLEINDQ